MIIQLGYKEQMSTTSIFRIWMLFHNRRRNEKKGKEIVSQEHKKDFRDKNRINLILASICILKYSGPKLIKGVETDWSTHQIITENA